MHTKSMTALAAVLALAFSANVAAAKPKSAHHTVPPTAAQATAATHALAQWSLAYQTFVRTEEARIMAMLKEGPVRALDRGPGAKEKAQAWAEAQTRLINGQLSEAEALPEFPAIATRVMGVRVGARSAIHGQVILQTIHLSASERTMLGAVVAAAAGEPGAGDRLIDAIFVLTIETLEVENQYLSLEMDSAEADHPQTALIRCNILGNEAMIAYLQYKRLTPDDQAAQRATIAATIHSKAAEMRVQASEMQRLAKLTAVRLRGQLAGTGNQSAIAILQQAMATYSEGDYVFCKCS